MTTLRYSCSSGNRLLPYPSMYVCSTASVRLDIYVYHRLCSLSFFGRGLWCGFEMVAGRPCRNNSSRACLQRNSDISQLSFVPSCCRTFVVVPLSSVSVRRCVCNSTTIRLWASHCGNNGLPGTHRGLTVNINGASVLVSLHWPSPLGNVLHVW